MARVHPLTKALVAVAAVAVPYLVWTAPEPGPVAAVNVRDEATLVPPVPVRPTVIPSLPPLQIFAATVERPLFAPSRRLPQAAAPEVDPAPVAATGASGPEEPDVRFFGTMGRGGQNLALVDLGDGGTARKLALGDEVGSWQVVAIERDRLVLGLGDDRRDFTILRGGTAAAAPAATEAGEAAPEVDPSRAADDAVKEGWADEDEGQGQ